MKVYSAMDLKNGVKVKRDRTTFDLSQPLQFIPNDEKDMDWAAWNLDWLEWNGLR